MNRASSATWIAEWISTTDPVVMHPKIWCIACPCVRSSDEAAGHEVDILKLRKPKLLCMVTAGDRVDVVDGLSGWNDVLHVSALYAAA